MKELGPVSSMMSGYRSNLKRQKKEWLEMRDWYHDRGILGWEITV